MAVFLDICLPLKRLKRVRDDDDVKVVLVIARPNKTKGKEVAKSVKGEVDQGVRLKELAIPESSQCVILKASLVNYKILYRIILEHIKLVEDLQKLVEARAGHFEGDTGVS